MATIQIGNRRKQEEKVIGSAESLVTVREACRMLNVHANTIRRWSNQGKIRTYRLGTARHRRFKAEELVSLLVENK